MKRSKEFTISRHIAVAIIYDDYSGLDIHDELDIERWFKDYSIDYIVVADKGDDPIRFTQCDITGLGNDCIDVIAYKQ